MFGFPTKNLFNGNNNNTETNNNSKQPLYKLGLFAFVVVISTTMLYISSNHINKKTIAIAEQAQQSQHFGNTAGESNPAGPQEVTEENQLNTYLHDIDVAINKTNSNINTLREEVFIINHDLNQLRMLILIFGITFFILIMLILWYESRKNSGIIDVMNNTQQAIDKIQIIANNTQFITKISSDTEINTNAK